MPTTGVEQGNIIALIDSSGSVVVEYKYDAWGNHAVLDANGADITDVNHIGVLNPFRYRGYFYDVETGLYYLKSRYYDPEIGRFITIDGIEYLDPKTINGLNLYAYCGNNPVMRTDSQGTNWWTDFWNGVAGQIIIMEISKVSATLEHGRIFSKGILVLLYIGTISAFLGFLIEVLMAVTNFLENGIAQGILFLCCVLLFCGIFVGGFTFLIGWEREV